MTLLISDIDLIYICTSFLNNGVVKFPTVVSNVCEYAMNKYGMDYYFTAIVICVALQVNILAIIN
jgi:hypothetical protein